jgi:hypothetical protein
MADFFTRVAERALGKRPLVSAVVPSMFAPDPRTGNPVPFDAVPPEEGEREVEPAVRPAPAAEGAEPQAGERAEDQHSLPPQRIPKPSVSPRAEQPADPLEHSRRVSFSPRGSSLPPDAAEQSRNEAASEASRKLEPASRQSPAQEQPAAERSAKSTPVLPVASSSAVPREEVQPPLPRQTRPRREAQTEDIEPRPARKPPIIPLPPDPLSNAPARERISSNSEPHTIRVTIGRVEVKAVVQPPPQKSAPPVKRELSLDDYLKQRKAGER